MRTKNAYTINAREREHMARIKALPCSCCGAAGPSHAHHIEQGLHFATIPLCDDCHVGSHNGIHGRRAIWNALKLTELGALAATVEQLTKERNE
jgi:hypothetical protein